MAVIDLDFSAEAPQELPARSLRWLGTALVLCGLMLIGGPEATPKPWAQDVAQFKIPLGMFLGRAGDDLLIFGGAEVIAYDLPSGREHWRTSTGLSGGGVAQHGDLLVVSGADPAALDGGQYRSRSIGLDRVTGRILWRVDGAVNLQGDLLVLYNESTVSLLREDGTKVWTLDGHGVGPVINEHGTVVATLDKATGELVERVLPSLLERRRVILPGAQGADGMWFYDGTLNVFHAETSIIRYDAATLAPLPGDPPEIFRVDCGRVWCMIKEGRLVDKATGGIVYETKGWEYAVTNDAGVLGLGIVIGDAEPTLVREIFDPRTGAVTDLQGWMALNLNPGAPISAPGRAIVLADRGDKSTYVAIFDDTGLHRLGLLPVTNMAQCVLADLAGGRSLACRIGADLVRIWRLT